MDEDDTFVADVLLATTESGDPRVNLGEHSDGEGFGADTALWANGDGFISVPNPTDGTGAAQVVFRQDGNDKRAFASRDNRYAARQGTLAPGDRAIVSNCDAGLLLKQATSDLKLASTDMRVELDGAGAKVTLEKGPAKVELSDTGLVLSFTASPAPTVSITIDATGVHITAPPGGFTVNGVPVIVP